MARYTTISDVRFAPDLEDSTLVSDAVINLAIQSAEDSIDNFTGVSWSIQQKTLSVSGTGSYELSLPILYLNKVLQVKCGSAPISTYGLSVHPGSKIVAPFKWDQEKSYLIKFSYGKEVTPEMVKYIAQLEAQRRARVILSKAKQRTSGSQIANEHGQFTYPNWSGRYGPSDDAEVVRILNDLRETSDARFSV